VKLKPARKHITNTQKKLVQKYHFLCLILKKIEVLDLETNIITPYSSIREAARALGIPRHWIDYNIKSNKEIPYKGRYVFNKID